MKANSQGKWISDLTPQTPVADAARRVLTLRLEAVRDCLGLALHDWWQDSEHIHQLRVATRRASAALDVFADCLPSKIERTARRQLRKIRRAAGEARDWDVFLGRLVRETRQEEDRAAVDMLSGYATAQRVPAQARLEKTCPNYPFGFERFMADALGSIRYRGIGKTTLTAFARPMLAGLLEELNQAAGGKQPSWEQLHQVRIVGKRLRYAIEIFVDCFGPGLRKELCPAVAELQEILGSVNDHFNAARLYATLAQGLRVCLPHGSDRYQPFVRRMQIHHESQLPIGRRRYEQWWEKWLDPSIQMAVGEIRAQGLPACHLFASAESGAKPAGSAGAPTMIHPPTSVPA